MLLDKLPCQIDGERLASSQRLKLSAQSADFVWVIFGHALVIDSLGGAQGCAARRNL